MPTACITHLGAHIRLKSERLEVWGRQSDGATESLLREIPIRDLDRFILEESVQISSSALAALLRAGIPVSVLGWNAKFLGGFLPAINAHGLARLRQYRRVADPPFQIAIAAKLVNAKLYNQRRVLQRLGSSRSESQDQPGTMDDTEALAASPSVSGRDELSRSLAWLDALFAPIGRASSVDELRGYEGAATARYFQTWAAFLPAEFPFERRSTRPPLNPVNACISFGSALLYNETVAGIHLRGLDPALGLLHETEDGRWSLALDLMEPFRPVLIEALALDLFSHRILDRQHFEQRDGGTFLNYKGRKKLLLQYERRMERQFMSESAGHRTTLRQQLEHQATMFKAALECPEKFEPFLMN